LPLGLIGSTALIAGTSVAMQYALGCTRNNRISVASRALQVAAVLAVGFLTLQTWNWMEVRSTLPSLPVPTLYGFTFYVLTGLHAVHVLGGLVPLGLVMNRTVQGQYSSSRSDGMAFCVQYWHFLGVVWLVLLAALYLVT
jgi:cytochrome c oxidase subunit 3